MKTFVLILVNVYMVHGYRYGECFPEMVNKTYLHLPPQNGPPVLNTPSNEECFQHCVEDVKCIAYTFKYDSLECSLFHLMPGIELPEKEIPCQSHCLTRYLALPHWCKDISNDTPIYHSLLTSFGVLCKNQLKMQMEFNRTKEFIDKMETNHKVLGGNILLIRAVEKSTDQEYQQKLDKIKTLENRINDLEQYQDKMEDKIDAMVKDRMRKLEDKIDAMDKVETITYSNGVYTGMTRNGKRHGLGTMKMSNGAMYVGNHENGGEHGYGVYLWSDGRMYSGGWVNGNRTGIGYFNWLDGRMFVGQYKDDKINGNGQYFWMSGSRYAGEWKDGTGSGIITYSDGTVEKGQWKYNNKV